VTTKYYTHFVTEAGKSRGGSSGSPGNSGNEWSGVVELRQPLSTARANR
jgi:hypothetical protein